MKQGRIRDTDIEEIRRRVNLIEIAGDYMQVKRAGRQFRALCPFHTEKTPSFYLDPVKNLYVCHGCGEGGDAIRLVEKLENLAFPEVIERLARRVGVELQYEQMSSADRAAFKRRARLIDAHRAAIERYHDVLLKHPDAEEARAYLRTRGFSKQTAIDFQIGYSTPGLAKHLKSRGFTDVECVDAGLAARTEDGSLADRFRGRVMFPIFDVTGDPVAFGGRRLRDEQGPKYLNSAESPIYKKSHLLYGMNWAKGEVVKGARALMVEGYTDVIALHQAGIREAVATCGTALGLDHLRTLQRFTQQVVLALDSDEAGSKAADRTYDQLIVESQAMGLALKVLVMTPGEDPADAIQKLGSDGFRPLIDDAIPLLEFVLFREAKRYNVGDPEGRARALAACLRLLAKTEHPAVRNEYARRLSDWVRVDPNVIYVELNKAVGGTAPKALADSALKRSGKQVRLEREALKIAIQFPEHAKEHADSIGPECFSIPSHRILWEAVAEGMDPELLEDQEARKAYNQLALQEPAGEVTDRLVAEIFGRLKEYVVSRQIDELKTQLQRLNPLEEKQTYEMLFARLIELEGTRRALVHGHDEGGED